MSNNEPITDGAPLIYADREEGVAPAYDIRTDRFELAVEATDYVTKSHLAQREQRAAAKVVEMKKAEGGEASGGEGAGNPQS